YKKDNQISLASFRKTNKLFTEAIKRLPEDRKQWRYGYESINEARPYIDEITNIYLEQFHAKEMKELVTILDEEVKVMKEIYGEESSYHTYKETKMNDLKKRMSNAILTEMRNVDKEEKTSLFRQKIAARQLHALDKSNKGNLFQGSHGNGKQHLHVSVIRLKQAMRKTFHDYKFERHMDEFDQMMEKD